MMHEVILNTVPFSFRVTTNSTLVINNLLRVYGSANLNTAPTENDFAHYSVSLLLQRKVGRPWKQQARFKCDDLEPFLQISHAARSGPISALSDHHAVVH